MNDDMFEKFKEILKESDDFSYRLLLLKLYEKYEKNYIEDSKIENNDFLALKIKNAYNNINNNVIKFKDKKEYYNMIDNDLLLLDNNINNFKIKDKKQIDKTIELITKLEASLDLNITFPEYLEKCINNEIKKVKKINKGDNL